MDLRRWRHVAALLLLSAMRSRASAQATPLRSHPLTSAPATKNAAVATDARAADVGRRFSELLAAARAREASSLSSGASGKTLARRAADDAETRIRPSTGTPMLLRAPAPQSSARAFQQSGESSARSFLRAHREVLGLDDPDGELALERDTIDELGHRHLRFSQRYAGLPVWPGEIAVHLDGAGSAVMTGAYVRSPREVVRQPEIGPARAVEIARGLVPDAMTAGEPELVIYAPLRKKTRLAWKVEVEASLAHRWLVLLDARTGHKLDSFDQVPHAAATGSGVDVFGTTRPLDLWEESGADFLVDTSKPMFDPSSDPPSPTTTRGGIIVLDARNQPPNDDPQTLPDLFSVTAASRNGPWLDDGVSAAFTLSETYDYYLERHGRNSIDGDGGNLVAVVRLGQNLFNAFWTNGLMLFGDAVPFPGGLDVTAHELTHGITEATAGLLYQDQSGAANEAFSDLFGENVEARSLGEPDWLKGAGVIDTPIQNYADCGSLSALGRPYPSRMSEYFNTSQDNGGVHENSCILNHAYYLLAQGMPGAIGIGEAEKIFYRALTTHLVRNSQFVDVRLACVLAAEEIFGAGSAQALATGTAFDAVEIFDGPATPAPPSFPGIDGPDATVYVYYDSDADDFYLGRRESALGDPEEGFSLSGSPVKAQRPSVSGDGSLALFVSSDGDACIIPTDASGDVFEECIGQPGTVYSVAISRDQRLLAFVLQDENGLPRNTISVVDTVEDTTHTFPLRAPLVDGQAIGTVLYAEVMDFSVDGRFLVYDAFDQIDLGNGESTSFFSIYALDLANDRTLDLVSPRPGISVGNPALAQTSDNFLAFDIVENGAGRSATIDLATGEVVDIAAIQGASFPIGIPGYSGDDTAVVYTQSDDEAILGLSLYRQAVTNRQTRNGDPTLWLRDAAYGVIYRRGDFTPPEPTATPTRVDTPTPTTTPTAAPCVGDCSTSGSVGELDVELALGVALEGGRAASACASLDRDGNDLVTVEEIVAAVVGKLYGCVGTM